MFAYSWYSYTKLRFKQHTQYQLGIFRFKMEFEDIKVKRSGATPNSFMITEDVIGSVHPGRKYKATINGLIETNSKSTIKKYKF